MHKRATRSIVALAAVAGLITGACSGSDSSSGTTTGPGRTVDISGATRAASLLSFDDCDALLDHLKQTAAAKVGPYGFGGGAYGGGVLEGDLAREETVSADVAAPVASGEGSGGTEGTDYSGTNNQEAGVDESDTVKTDGARMIVLRNDVLTLIDVSDPGSPVRRARLDLLEGADASGAGTLLLDGDRVLVMLDRWEASGNPDQPVSSTEDRAIYPGPGGQQVTELIVVSIADLEAPQILDRSTVDGSVLAARLVDGQARVVVRSTPLGFSWVYPSGPQSEAAAKAANIAIIEASTIEQWLPQLRHDGDSGPAVECADVNTPPTFAGLGMVTIHTVAMADSIEPRSTGLLADSETVYASTGRLYVTAAEYVDPNTYNDADAWEELSESYRTDIHEFDISGDQATYEVSGQVRGHPLNQWAMSELDGRLRIATTDGPPWARPMGEDGSEGPVSESFLTVFENDGEALVQAGQVGGMGKGEMIRSVRFDGATAYVVTFRQTDPFYVVDLSEPSTPRLAGELKIPGYSGYLHPVGDGRVLGVGSDGTEDGRITGIKVSLFDVSDPAAPTELSNWRTEGGSTDVEFDAKAFLWWAATNLAVVPVNDWGSPIPLAGTDSGSTSSSGATNLDGSGAVGLRVTADSIEQVGFVSHDRTEDRGATECRTVPAEEITSSGFGVYIDGSSLVVDCGPGQAVTVIGYSCSEYGVDDLKSMNPEGDDLALAEGHRIGVCYPDSVPPVNRSIVVGDRLITLTQTDLLSSDLDTLAPGSFLDL